MQKNITNPKIGIVSGVGPLAGADVLRKVFQYAAYTYGAVEDTDYPEVVLINRGAEGVDSKGVLNSDFKRTINSIVHQLETNDATVIGIACNTAHVYLDTLTTQNGAQIVNLIDRVAYEASKNNHRYLLLTSATSREQKLYNAYLAKYSVQFTETTPEQQETLDKAIALVMGYKLKEAGKLLETILLQATEDGIEAVIAGCTELPIAIDNAHHDSGMHIVDSNYTLAQSLADNYYESLGRTIHTPTTEARGV